jgi:hypothetical protein
VAFKCHGGKEQQQLRLAHYRPYGVGTGLVMQNMVPAPNFEDEAVVRTAGNIGQLGLN